MNDLFDLIQVVVVLFGSLSVLLYVLAVIDPQTDAAPRKPSEPAPTTTAPRG